jgi:predicted nucleotide-binding protein (sugar kinase/HSP70/actin superfamily)
MIILQALTNSISSIPYGIQYLYSAITLHLAKDEYRLAQEHLFLQISRLSYYINFISAFYIYYISSQQIRSIIKYSLKSKKKSNIKHDLLLLDVPYKSQSSKNSNLKKKFEHETFFNT